MRKARIAKILGIAAAVPVLTVATTTSAYAGSGYNITWTQNATGHCLYWQNSHDNFSVSTDYWCTNNGASGSQGWDDVTGLGLENPAGDYQESPKGRDDICLTAYWAPSNTDVGHAYLEPCSSPVNYYEQWNEVNTGHGWELINRETGACLDADGSGNVYTRPCAPNTDNQYQLWH